MLDFGSIFRFKEVFYVYLLQTDEFIYVAKILDAEVTKTLIRFRDLKSKDPRNNTDQKPMYCFVVLSTDGFFQQAAHYEQPGMSTDSPVEPMGHLSEVDSQLLRDEIKSDTAVNAFLKKSITELFPE